MSDTEDRGYDPEASFDELAVNFAGVETTTFEPIPPGTYRVRIDEWEPRQSGENAKNPGAWYINWTLVVTEGPFEGRKLWDMTSLLPKALFSLKGLAYATGQFAEGELDGSFKANEVAARCEGSEVLAVVKIKPANEEKGWDAKNEVKRYRPLGSSDVDESLLP